MSSTPDLTDLSKLDTLDILGAHGSQPFGYIYLITNTVNGKRYVGQTVNPISQRFYQHRYGAQHNPTSLVSYAIAKHGEDNFTCDELHRCHNYDDLNAAENYYIYGLDTIVDHGKGYNLTWGGGGHSVSEQSREKMKVAKAIAILKARLKRNGTLDDPEDDDIEIVAIEKMNKYMRDRSCSPSPNTTHQAATGNPVAKAIVNSWRFSFPVTVVTTLPDNPFTL